MKQFRYGAVLLVGLAGCAPTQDGLYTLVVSANDRTWVEIEPKWKYDTPEHIPPATYRVWYMHQPSWRWWGPERYELTTGPLAALPLVQHLRGDTIAVDFLEQAGRPPQKYTFHGAWPAVQRQR